VSEPTHVQKYVYILPKSRDKLPTTLTFSENFLDAVGLQVWCKRKKTQRYCHVPEKRPSLPDTQEQKMYDPFELDWPGPDQSHGIAPQCNPTNTLWLGCCGVAFSPPLSHWLPPQAAQRGTAAASGSHWRRAATPPGVVFCSLASKDYGTVHGGSQPQSRSRNYGSTSTLSR